MEPLSETATSRYLKLITVTNICPFTFISLWKALASFIISLYLNPNNMLFSLQTAYVHTGYSETTTRQRTTNATEINKQSQRVKYLSWNNLPRIKLIRGKLFPDRYLHPIPAVGFSYVCCCLSYWLSRVIQCDVILERTAGLEPLSETATSRYLKLITVTNICPFTFISLWTALALIIFVVGLWFYVHGKHLWSCRGRSVNLTTLFLDRLRPPKRLTSNSCTY